MPTVMREIDIGPFPNELEREKDPSIKVTTPYEKTSLTGAIWNQSNMYSNILNTYIIKWEKRPESEKEIPSAIMAHPLKPDIEQLKRIRQIKYGKTKKKKLRQKRQKNIQEPESPPIT
jgi:hypothetical protein